MKTMKILRQRRIRREGREPVPKWRLVPKVAKVSEKNRWVTTVLVVVAVLMSAGAHLMLVRASVKDQEKNSYLMQVTQLRKEKEEKKPEEKKPEEKKPEDKTGPGNAEGPKADDKPAGHKSIDDARNVANTSALLGALDQGNEAMDKLFDGSAIDPELDKSLADLNAVTGVDARGTSGLGMMGAGMGGGGGSALGMGGLGSKGRGGWGSGYMRGALGGGAAKGKHGSNMAKVDQGAIGIQGALDKGIIQKIIEKHLNQIRFCYQKELNKNPNLYGKITVKFTISGNGTVSQSSIATTTMRNNAVEDCVVRVMRNIIFPAPKNGGIVIVNYPFVFKPM